MGEAAKERGRPVTKPLPPRIHAPPEDTAKAILTLPCDYRWEYLRKKESETKRESAT